VFWYSIRRMKLQFLSWLVLSTSGRRSDFVELFTWLSRRTSVQQLIVFSAWRGGSLRRRCLQVIQHIYSRSSSFAQRHHHWSSVLHCSSVSSVPSSEVPLRLLRASLRSFRLPTSPFGQPSQTQYSAVSSQHFWRLRAFSVAGPTVWNSLRDQAVESYRFRRDFITHLFADIKRHERKKQINRPEAVQ